MSHVSFYAEKIRAGSCSSACPHSPGCMGKSSGQASRVMFAYTSGVAWSGFRQRPPLGLNGAQGSGLAMTESNRREPRGRIVGALGRHDRMGVQQVQND